jgi:hypothetical protein
MANPDKPVVASPLSFELVTGEDGNPTTVPNFLLQAANNTLATGHVHDRERTTLESVVRNFPSACQKLDEALSMLPSDVRGEAGIAAASLMLAAQAIGALCYGSNAARSFLAPKIITEATSQRQRTAGQRSGEKRKMNRLWTSHAIELAREIRQERPDFSQDKVAQEISARWKLDVVNEPGHNTLVGFVRELEMNGTIARRVPFV